jgi:hypothetical protein
MSPVTFRNSKIIYYGPHTCENCGVMIVRMGREWGGTAFTNPRGPIYPNTEWHPHVCDQQLVQERRGMSAAAVVREHFPHASSVLLNGYGFVIIGEPCVIDSQHALVVSPNSTYHDTEHGAWIGALERIENNWPTWHVDLRRHGVHGGVPNSAPGCKLGDDLERLPECPK